MVLLRVRSQGDALFKNTIVPWVAESNTPLVDSLPNLLGELSIPRTMEEFLDEYEFWSRGCPLDMNGSPQLLRLTPGSEIFVKPKGRGQGQREIDPSFRERQEISPPSLHRDTVDAATPATNLQQLFDQFLERHELGQWRSSFYSEGIRSLTKLACATTEQVNRILSTESANRSGTTPTQGGRTIAFNLISLAHEELVKQGIAIDWHHRLTELYSHFNPERVSQVPNLLEAYKGEEEELWKAIREKYEGISCQPSGDEGFAQAQPHREGYGNEVSCPACHHRFMVQDRTQFTALEQMNALEKSHSDEMNGYLLRIKELETIQSTIRMQLEESQKLTEHYRKISSEQEEWLGMLEKRLAFAEQELVNREMAAVKGIPREPITASSSPSTLEARALKATSPRGRDLTKPTAALQLSAGATHGNTPLTEEQRQRLRRKLVDFYIKHAREKLELVDHVLDQWEGREGELERLIGIEPSLLAFGQRRK